MDGSVSLEKTAQEFLDFEREILGMQLELSLKRKQVEQLRKDIDAEKIKTHDLSRALEGHKNKVKQSDLNLSIALQSNQSLENKLQEKSEETGKLQLQNNLSVAESKTLRELLHKSEMEKFELTHTIEDLREQNRCHEAFRTQLIATEQELRSFITDIRKELAAVESENKNFIEVAKEVNLCKEMNSQNGFLNNRLKELECENHELERRVIAAQTKYDVLEELLEDHSFIFFPRENLQIPCGKCVESHRDETETLQAIIKEYSAKLSLEQEANNVLIVRDEEKTAYIHELQTALERRHEKRDVETQTPHEDGKIEVKQEEIIEID